MGRFLTFTWVMIVPGLAALLLGLGLLAADWREVSRAKGWPVVEGRVAGTDRISETSRTKRGPIHSARPVLLFRYRVAGVDHLGRRAWIGHWPRFHDPAEFAALQAAYPTDSPVQVRHDPADPARAAVFITMDWERGLALAIPGVLILSMGLLFRALTGDRRA